jgi:peptide/nickel transport system substrate-binding protein
MTTSGAGGPAENARTLVVAAHELPISYDPDDFLPSHPAEDSDIAIQLFDRLLSYEAGDGEGGRSQDLGRLTGELAESWKTLDGGLRHRLRLRPLPSEHGHTLSAEDVVWSWRRGIDRRQVGRWVAFMGSVPRHWEPGHEVRALDERTVEFTLEKPNQLFPHLLTMQVPPILDATVAQAHASDADPTGGDWLRDTPGGYGPYAVERRDERELVLVAGEVDLIFEPTAKEQRRLAGSAGPGGPIELFRERGNGHVALQMDARRPPFDEIEVRRALALAVPYEQILREVYGAAARPWRGVVPDTHNGYLDSVELGEDIEASRAALARSGRSSLSAVLHCDAAAEDLVAVAERVAVSALRAGIDLEVQPLPTGDFKGRQMIFEMPLAIDRDGHRCNEIGYGLPHDFGDRRHGITNWVQYANAEVNALIEEAEGERDAEARRALFKRGQRLIAADVPWAFIAQPYFCVAHRRGLAGLSWHSRLGGHPRYAELRWESAPAG